MLKVAWLGVWMAVALMVGVSLQAQTGRTVSGIVVDESGGAVAGARVTLESPDGRPAGSAVAGADGSFQVAGLGAGALVAVVEMRQFEPARVEFTVPAGSDPDSLRVVLRVAGLVEAVRVQASTLTQRSATAATRFEADALSVPQSTQSVTAALLEAQGIVDVGDALKQVPSAFAGHTRLAPFTSFSWRLRGLDAAVTRNGFRQLYFEDVDQSAFLNVERVDVIKGPGGAVYGKEGLGGVIQFVTRRPVPRYGATGYVSLGQFDTRAGGFDVTGPLADTGVSVRLNGELERSGTFVDAQDLDRSNMALSVSTDQRRRVRGFLSTEYLRRSSLPHPGLPVVGTVTANGVADVPRGQYLGEPGVDDLRTWSPLVQAWVDIDLTRDWTLSPRYQRFTFNVDQQQMRVRGLVPGSTTLVQRNGRYDFHERDRTQTVQLELKGRRMLGATTHQIAAGYEVNRHNYRGDWFDYVGTPAVNTLSPSYLAAPPGRAATRTSFSGDINTREPYLQDLVGVGRLDLLLGIRRSDIRIDSEFLGFLTPDQNHAGTSWQLGGAFRVAPAWSLFAGASTGLSVDNIVGATAADGSTFEPERSRQVEVGVKHQGSRTSASAAYFDIRFANATTTDPANPDFSLQIGAQRSRGFEVEAAVQGGSRWFVTAGLALIDATITESFDGDIGNRLPNVARVQANVWGRVDLHPRVQAGAGVNVVGRRFGTIGNGYELPAYGTVDGSVSWQASPRLVVEFFAQNLFDQTYYTGSNNFSVYPGEPRTVRVRLRTGIGPR